MCYHIVKMQERFGKHYFDIIPDTFVLPDEFADFYSHFHKAKNARAGTGFPATHFASFTSGHGGVPSLTSSAAAPTQPLWIIKPAQSSRGRGVYLIEDVAEVPIDESCVVSKYVGNPFLINGLKFDLRIYVLVSSIEPLRIYVFN